MLRTTRTALAWTLLIALTAWCVLFAAVVAERGNPGWDRLFVEGVFALFGAGVIALVALGVLSAAGFRTEPWRVRNRIAERVSAVLVSGALLSLALLTMELPTYPASLPFLAPLLCIFAIWTVRHRRGIRVAARRLRDGSEVERLLLDVSLPDAARAECLQRAVAASGHRAEGWLRTWLPHLLDQSVGPFLDAALFAILEKTKGPTTEALLARLLENESPRVQVKAAHMLAWFGTTASIGPLHAVTGSGSDAARAAGTRIQHRARSAEPGALALASAGIEGALSIEDQSGALGLSHEHVEGEHARRND